MGKLFSVVLAIACLGVVLPSKAQTTCSNADMEGGWDVYSIGAGFGVYWSFCRIEVDASGNIAGGTECRYDDGSRTTIEGGRVAVFRGCRVAGFFDEDRDGAVERFDVTPATMHAGKQLVVGITSSRTNDTFTLINAVRR